MNFFRGKRVFVTGAGGFIGSHLSEMLLHAGAQVSGSLSKRPNPKNFLKNQKDILLQSVDLQNASEIKGVLKNQDLLFHCAGSVGGLEFNLQHPGSIFRDNMSMGLAVLEAARQVNLEKVLLTSSACVYPRYCTIPTPESEGFKDFPEPTNQGYGWAKRMLEFSGEMYAQEFNLPICIARPYNAYGPRDNFDPRESHVIPALIHRVMTGENPLKVWGSGQQSRSFLFVRDFVRGLMATMAFSQRVAAYNLGTKEEVTIAQLAKTIVECSGKNTEIIFDDSKPTGQPRRACDTTQAERDLAFVAKTSLRDGLSETIAWYCEHGAGVFK